MPKKPYSQWSYQEYEDQYGRSNYYGNGVIDPATGRKLPKSFINTPAYIYGSRIEQTCGGPKWWEDHDPQDFEYDEEEALRQIQEKEAKRRTWWIRNGGTNWWDFKPDFEEFEERDEDKLWMPNIRGKVRRAS